MHRVVLPGVLLLMLGCGESRNADGGRIDSAVPSDSNISLSPGPDSGSNESGSVRIDVSSCSDDVEVERCLGDRPHVELTFDGVPTTYGSACVDENACRTAPGLSQGPHMEIIFSICSTAGVELEVSHGRDTMFGLSLCGRGTCTHYSALQTTWLYDNFDQGGPWEWSANAIVREATYSNQQGEFIPVPGAPDHSIELVVRECR